CHVMTDERLIAAGHASGDDFDLSKKYVPVSLHFKKTYDAAELAAIARGELQAVLRRRGRPTPAITSPTGPLAAPAEATGASTASAAASASAPNAAPAAAAPVAVPQTPAESVSSSATPVQAPGAPAKSARLRPVAR